jgi:transcriptional regulator GlxA family with amidase domain
MVGATLGPVRTDTGRLGLVVDTTYDQLPRPEVILVPGGPGQNDHRAGSALHAWLTKADAHSIVTASVCTGSLILASAGLLADRRATTHWLAHDDLADFGALPTSERVVVDGKYVTAAGVSAGIDMALALAGMLVGNDTARAIQLGIEYDPQPPYASGNSATAAPETVARIRQVRDFIV